MKMKKKPLLVVVVSGFWVGYALISLTLYIHQVTGLVNKDAERRINHAEYHLFTSQLLMAEENIEGLRQNLQKARDLREFDYFILKKGDEILAHYNKDASAEASDFHIPMTGKFENYADGRFVAKTVQVLDYSLTVGVNMVGSEFVLGQVYAQRWAFVQDFLIVTTFLGLLLYWGLKDIIDLSRVLRGAQRKKTELIKVRSAEAETLLTVTSQFEKVTSGLKLDNEIFSQSVSPAVRAELEAETLIPSTFECAVVRIDVNGYTQMFLEKRAEFVVSTLNRYFVQATEIIGRYGGLIYQFVGDEIVFHIKNPDKAEAMRLAVSCVRSLFEVAHEIDQDLRPQGVPFVVKASVALGSLRFVQLTTGYAFAGTPLIESVRMLGKIDEKEENVLAFYAHDAEFVADLCEVHKHLKVSFKGFEHAAEICEVKKFAVADQALLAGERFRYFRGDLDIATALEFLRARSGELSKEAFTQIYRLLAQVPAQRCSGVVIKAYGQLLAAAAQLDQTSSDRGYMVAALTSLGGRLLRGGVLEAQTREIFERNLEHPDQRVRGNSVLTLDELSPETYSFKQMFNQPFNRAAADALMVEGKRDFNDEVYAFLKGFLHSKDPFFVASGLYVLAYLYDFHRKHDSIYFTANPLLQNVPGLVSDHLVSGNEMVKKRAHLSMALIQQLNSPT